MPVSPDDGAAENGGVAGDVLLVVPAAPEYLRLVRLTAAGLASRMGFSFDEVEDLRIAVDELCHLLVGSSEAGREAGTATGGDGPRTIELRYRADSDSIDIDGSTDLGGPTPEPNELSLQILTALVDDVNLRSDDGRVAFRLVKRRERA